MRIVSWNINGIRAVHKKGLLVPFIEKYKPDILCLQETKAKQDQSEVDLPEYEEYWNSASRRGYSGTAIFTKQKPISISSNLPDKIAKKYKIEDDGYGNPNEEGRLLTLEYEDFNIVSVYTPNAKDDLSRIILRHEKWDPAFLDYMKELENPPTDSTSSLQAGEGQEKPVIFCGDLNVAHTEDDLARPKENSGNKGFTCEEREGIQNIINAGFVDTFRIFTKGPGYYTWWTHFANARARNIGWRIDYVFVSRRLADKVKEAKILPEVLGSDHCPVLIDIKI